MTPREEQELAAQAREEAEALFGVGVAETTGVTQVSATVRAEDGLLHVLAIGENPPKSATDFFALNLARARADAVLTSAANVRSEPMLSHRLAGPAAASLAALRVALGKSQPLTCVILTASGNLPLEHPIWSDGSSKVVLTLPTASEQLAAHLGVRAQVVALEELTPRSAIAWLKRRAHTIDVEAGPSTTSALYSSSDADAPLVNELLLSRFEGPLEPAALGRALPPDELLLRGLTCVHESRRQEVSGPWVFQRWVRLA